MAYQFGDVVLVPFPFTDQSAAKQRPGVIVSSVAYHRAWRDLILMAITPANYAAVTLSAKSSCKIGKPLNYSSLPPSNPCSPRSNKRSLSKHSDDSRSAIKSR